MTNFLLKRKYLISLVAVIAIAVPMVAFGTDENSAPKADWIDEILWKFVVSVFGTLVWIAGKLLNVAVESYVVGFANQFNNLGLGFAVNDLWRLVRDIFNLLFIFGLVYIGFKMILNTNDSSARTMLVHIILAALLVNFSLFFTKFVIDFSNIAATQVAQAFYKPTAAPTEDSYQVSDQFVQIMGISSIWADDLSAAKSLADGKASGFAYIFFTMILFIITAFVFFAGAILLLIRFVVLNIYMILSPIMFLGWIFPSLASYSINYWKGFLSRAFFAPIYLILLYFSYFVMSQYASLINNASETNFRRLFMGEGDAGSTFAVTVPYFAMMSIFLIASVIIAQKSSSDFASGINNFAVSRAGRITGAIAVGLPSRIIRSQAGSLADKASRSNFLKERGSTIYGKAATSALRKLANSNYDARNLDLVKSGAEKIGLDLGKGLSAGYLDNLKAQQKSDKEYAEFLERNKTRDDKGNLLPEIQNRAKEKIEESRKESSEKITNYQEQVKDMEGQLEKIEKTEQNTDSIAKLEKAISDLNKSITSEENNIKSLSTPEKISALTKNAELEYKYKYSLEYIDSLNKRAKFWSNDGNLIKVGAGAGAGLVGTAAYATNATVSGAMLPISTALVAGVGSAKAYSYSNQQRANALTAIYGKDGVSKDTRDQKVREAQILQDILNSNSTTPAPNTPQTKP